MRLVLLRVAVLALAAVGSASCAVTPKTSPGAQGVASDSCAAKLSPEASLVYRASALDMRRDTDLPTLLRARVMMLVFTDQLTRGAARPAAEQAAVCLEELRHSSG